jgi:hypothetical protein
MTPVTVGEPLGLPAEPQPRRDAAFEAIVATTWHCGLQLDDILKATAAKLIVEEEPPEVALN